MNIDWVEAALLISLAREVDAVDRAKKEALPKFDESVRSIKLGSFRIGMTLSNILPMFDELQIVR